MKATFTFLLLLLLASTLFAQSNNDDGGFDYYFSREAKGMENHRVFTSTSNIRLTMKTGEEMAQDLEFNRQYDSVFQSSPTEFEWGASLPPGARFDGVRKFLYWKPSSNNVGDNLIVIRVRHRDVVDSVVFAVRVEEKWQSSLIPGANFAQYTPVGIDEYGSFTGVSVEYLLTSWIARNNNRGPSHGRLYVRFELLESSKPDIKESMFYTAGLNLSMERNPHRLYAIPYFGIEVGGMYNAKWGNIFQFTPLFGVWLYSDQTNTVSLNAGYVIPSDHFESLRGWRASIGGTFSLW